MRAAPIFGILLSRMAVTQVLRPVLLAAQRVVVLVVGDAPTPGAVRAQTRDAPVAEPVKRGGGTQKLANDGNCDCDVNPKTQ